MYKTTKQKKSQMFFVIAFLNFSLLISYMSFNSQNIFLLSNPKYYIDELSAILNEDFMQADKHIFHKLDQSTVVEFHDK